MDVGRFVLLCSLTENEVWSKGPYGDPREVESVPYQLSLYIGGECIPVCYPWEKVVVRTRRMSCNGCYQVKIVVCVIYQRYNEALMLLNRGVVLKKIAIYLYATNLRIYVF